MICTRCNGYKNFFGVNCISYSGRGDAEIMFLGEMAGRDEAETSKEHPAHFIGKAGDIFTTLLDTIHFSRNDFSIVNSHRCWKDKNETPTKKELDTCFIHLWNDIRKLKPLLVVAMGESAFYQATGKEGIGIHHGRLLWSEKIKCNVFPIYHPMAIGYDPKKKDDLFADFKKIPDILYQKPEETKHYKYEYIQDVNHFYRIYRFLAKSDIIYLDLETTGLDPFIDNITILQIGTGEEPVYIIDGSILLKIKEHLGILFSEKEIVGQDFSFDAKFIYTKLGIFLKNWSFDTCLAEYISTGFGSNDLDFLTGKYALESFGYSDAVKKVGGAHLVQDKDILLQYASNDIGVLLPIRRQQYKTLLRESMYNLFSTIVMPSNKILTKMSMRGVLYDMEQLWKIDKKYRKKADKALEKALTLPEVQEVEKELKQKFNPRSPLHLRKLLLENYGLPVLKTTRKKNPMVSKKEMKIYAGKYKNPYCKIMEQYRSYQTLRDNFLSGVVPKLNNNVAHTNYSLHSTTTGRPNSTNPNLLNTPREKDVKKILIARPGYKFVVADFAQLEVRIASVVYDEPKLIEICNDLDKDIHSSITAKAFGKTYDEVYSGYKAGDTALTELRVKGKAVQFGVIYQQGAQALGYSLGIKEEKAQEFIDEYYESFPSLAKNIENTKQEVIENGYLDNYFGFRRRWKHHGKEDHGTLREGVNFLVQSLAFNVLELSLINIDTELERRDLRSALVMQVYDSIVIEAVDEEVSEVALLINKIMKSVIMPYNGINRVLLKADVEVGENLGELSKVA